MTQLLLTIVIGIGIAVVATAGALTLFQSARDGVDQQLLWARMEQTAAALRAKTLIVDGLPVLPMAETTTDSYPAVPGWVTASAFDNNGKRFVYCPFALRDTSAEGSSTTVTGPGYSVKTYNSAITGGKDYVVGAVRPAMTGTTSAAPQGLLGLLISFKPKDTYSASVAANWCTASSLAVSAAGVISATYSSQTGVVYPISAPQGPVQQALTKRDSVTLYVSTSASGDGTGRNASNYTTLNAAYAQLAALRPLRAKLYLTAGTHSLTSITKTDAGGNDVYNRGNLQQTTYDIEGVGSGSTTVTLNLTGDYDLPVNMIWRSLTIGVNDTERVIVQPNTKTIIAASIVNNLYVKQGTAWVTSGTSALNTSVTVTDMGRLVINGTTTSSVPDQGIKLQPGRIDILPAGSWTITATSAASTPSAPVIVYGGGTLSNSGTMSITSNGSTQLKSAINIVPGGVVNMNNATLSLNSGSSTIAGDGSTRMGAIVAGGEMYMVNSGLLFPGGTSTNVAGVVLVDGGKFFMHANSYIGSSGTAAQRPYYGVYDNGGAQVGGSTAGYSSGAAGEGGGARSNIYAASGGACWEGNGDPYSLGIPAAQKRHLFIDSAAGTAGNYSSPRDTCGSNTDGTCSASSVANILTYTDSLNSPAWTNFGTGTTTITARGIDAQDGSRNAIRLSATRSNTSQYTARSYVGTPSLSGSYKASIYVRAATAGDIGKEIEFWQYANSGVRNVTKQALTGSWARMVMNHAYAFTGTPVGEQFNIGLLDTGNGGSSAATSVAFDVWGAQLEAGTTANTYAPVGHTSASGAADYRHLRFTNGSDWACTGPSGGGGGGDTDPDAFAFASGCGGLSTSTTPYDAGTSTPTGYDTAAPISISCTGCGLGNAQYKIGVGGTWTTSAGTVSPGDVVYLRFNFCSNATYSATVTIGTTVSTACSKQFFSRLLPAC